MQEIAPKSESRVADSTERMQRLKPPRFDSKSTRTTKKRKRKKKRKS